MNNYNHLQEGRIFTEPLLFGLFFGICYLLYEILQSDHEGLFSRLQQFWIGHKVFRLATYYAVLILILTQLNGSMSFIYEMF